MRIRTVKPEFWTDGFIVSLPHFARLLYIALWSVADDHGYIADEPDRIAMQIFPQEALADVWGWIDFFVVTERLELHVTESGTTFYRISKWEKHQRVDKPGKSRVATEPSRKLAIPQDTRRAVAAKYKCTPGQEKEVACYYCGAPGKIHWHTMKNGKPSGWVSFSELELDHVMAESEGGAAKPDNIVLACRNCNRSKGTKDWFAFFSSRALASPRETLPLSLELSSTDQGSGNGIREKEPGTGITSAPASPAGARARNVLFDALAAATGINPNELVGPPAASCGVAIAAIIKATPDVTPDEIKRRAVNYGTHFRDAALTPSALAKHWAQCVNEKPDTSRPGHRKIDYTKPW